MGRTPARILSLAARILGYCLAALPLLFIIAIAYGTWSRHQQLEWQVHHPVLGTDPARLRPYFPRLTGIEQCEWAEGLKGSADSLRPYRKGISGFLKLTPECRKRVEKMTDLISVDSKDFGNDFESRLLIRKPFVWYATSIPPGFMLAPKYVGTFYYEKTNGIVMFVVVVAPD